MTMPNANAPLRQQQLHDWAATRHALAPGAIALELAAGDASFRRYFRLTLPCGTTRMLMDAPPEHEDSRPFVAIARRWRAAGLPVPGLHAVDLDAGFLELDDLGDTPLQVCLREAAHPVTLAWHERALALLHTLQIHTTPDALPRYDEALLGREIDLFPQWCLDAWLGLDTPPGWSALREALIASALAQPVVTVHRDYDAMNLMVDGDRLTLIDFQDAVAGPISYDLISLLRGRYCRFAPARFAGWVDAFRRQAMADQRLAGSITAEAFHRQVQAMAAQRALKVLGIFCRLTLRDRREGYLERLPHFLDHLDDSLADLPEHRAFRHWLVDHFRPALTRRLTAHSRGETS